MHQFELALLECPDFIWMVEALEDYFVHRSSPFAAPSEDWIIRKEKGRELCRGL
jgi:hypothetical protein